MANTIVYLHINHTWSIISIHLSFVSDHLMILWPIFTLLSAVFLKSYTTLFPLDGTAWLDLTWLCSVHLVPGTSFSIMSGEVPAEPTLNGDVHWLQAAAFGKAPVCVVYRLVAFKMMPWSFTRCHPPTLSGYYLQWKMKWRKSAWYQVSK